AIRAKHLVERFPGVERVDFVQLLAWVEPRRGPCWSELSPVHRTPVTMRYSLRGWNPIAETERAEGLEELLARGWTRIYRAPQGEGVEHRAPFAALDLSYGPELRCRCAGVGAGVEESKSAVRHRLGVRAVEHLARPRRRAGRRLRTGRGRGRVDPDDRDPLLHRHVDPPVDNRRAAAARRRRRGQRDGGEQLGLAAGPHRLH